MPPPASFRCWPEPTARHTVPSARATIGFTISCAIIVWSGIGAICRAATADLDAPITATWNGIGLREWARRVSDTAGMPVLVDRRLDPDTTVRLECRDEPLLAVLERAAASAGGEVATLTSSVLIVPRGTAAVFIRAEAARVARLASLPARQRSVLNERMPWQWTAGARPRDLLTAAATHAGITLEGAERVPHDHLPATSLPEMTLAERLDLLLRLFELRVDWQAASATAHMPSGRIIPIDAGLPPAAASVASSNAATSAGGQAGRRPKAQPKNDRPQKDQPQPTAGRQTFSLQVAAPLEELLEAVATRLALKLDLDRDSLARGGIAPGEIVRATVKDASRDQLLDAILEPLALQWTINGDTLRVSHASEALSQRSPEPAKP